MDRRPPHAPPPYPRDNHRPRRRGRFRRIFRGYLMTVGAATTIYILFRLLVMLFVEIGNHL